MALTFFFIFVLKQIMAITRRHVGGNSQDPAGGRDDFSAESGTSEAETPPTRPGLPKRLERGACGAAFEWLLMIFLMAWIFQLVNWYQSEKLAMPLSLEQAGRYGFSEVAAREHIGALVELGPHPVGTKALDKAMMVLCRTPFKLKQLIYSSAL
jgi:hypothetical protein